MINYPELFEQLKDLQKHVCYVRCFMCEVVSTDNGFRFKELTFDMVFQTFGNFNEENILDAFVNEENEPLQVDKPGVYEFDALLRYDKGEADEYGRYYIRPYMFIECIEFKYMCTAEEMNHMNNDQNNTPLL